MKWTQPYWHIGVQLSSVVLCTRLECKWNVVGPAKRVWSTSTVSLWANCAWTTVVTRCSHRHNTNHSISLLYWYSTDIRCRDAREWLFSFPLPPIPLQSIPIPSHSHSQFCNQFPFQWDSRKAFPIPSHSHSRTLHRCSIKYFWAREDSSLNMPLKLTISCAHFYGTETRKIVVENIIFLSCNIIAY